MPRRRSPSLSDPRSVLGTRGDIAVGALANRQRRMRRLVALFGLGLIALAVWLYFALNPSSAMEGGWTRQVMVECVKCDWRGAVAVPPGAVAYPLDCPKCRARACHQLWECRSCGHLFLSKGQGPILRCPSCGGKAIGAAREATESHGSSDEPQGSDPNGR